MKYIKLTILFIISLLILSPVWAGEKNEKPQDIYPCPGTLIVDNDMCLICHVVKDGKFGLRETAPDADLVYPNRNTKIIDGKGYFILTDISHDEIKEFFDYMKLHKIQHVIIEMHSPGGSLFDAHRIVGLMRYWQSQGVIVETRIHGYAASAAFYIFVSGSKGYRFANSQAELMWHQLKSGSDTYTTPAGAEEESRILQHLQNTLNKWIAEISYLTKEEIDEKVINKEFWVSGEEAVKYGFADGLLN